MVSGCNPFPDNLFGGSLTLTAVVAGSAPTPPSPTQASSEVVSAPAPLNAIAIGGPVSPDANGNINLAVGPNLSIVGSPATNTLTFTGPNVSGFTWVTVRESARPIVRGTGYIDRFAGPTQYQLPAASVVGDTFIIVGTGLGYQVRQGQGQQIFIGTQGTTVGPTGYIESQNTGSSVYLVCSTDNQEWRAISVQGNLNVV